MLNSLNRFTAAAAAPILLNLAMIVTLSLAVLFPTAGHAAAYVLHHAVYEKGFTDRLVLVAPTWRGPLPTMAGGQRPWFANIRRLIEVPGADPLAQERSAQRPNPEEVGRD